MFLFLQRDLEGRDGCIQEVDNGCGFTASLVDCGPGKACSSDFVCVQSPLLRYKWYKRVEEMYKWNPYKVIPILGSPVIGKDGTIYFKTTEKLYAVSQDGEKMWEKTLPGVTEDDPVDNPLVVDQEGRIYYTSCILYALSPKGSLLWKKKVGKDKCLSPPAVGRDGIFYILSYGEFKVYALDPERSKPLWSIMIPTVGSWPDADPVIGKDGTVFLGARGKVVAVAPQGQIK